MSLSLSSVWFDWDDHLLYLIDSPGSQALAHERGLAISGADAAYVVVSAPDGVEFGTEQALRDAAQQGVPRVVVLNKMDRGGDSEGIRMQLERSTGLRVVPMQIPFFEDGRLVGLVSLLQRKLLRYADDCSGEYTVEDVPTQLSSETEAAWEHVMESVALTDDDLLEHYLEYLELPVEMIQRGMARAMRQGLLIPMLYASAQEHIGAQAILDMAPWALPEPGSRPLVATNEAGVNREIALNGPFTARLLATRLDMDDQPYHLVRVLSGVPPRDGQWTAVSTGVVSKVRKLYQVRGPRRTTAVNILPGSIIGTWDALDAIPGEVFSAGETLRLPAPPKPVQMVSWMLTPSTKNDANRLDDALDMLIRMDSGLGAGRDPLTGQPVLTGTTRGHLDHALRCLEVRLGVRVTSALPPVAYREVPASAVRGIQGVHLKSGPGDEVQEFGECWIDLDPADPDRGISVVQHANDDTIPTRYHGALIRGFERGLRSGPLAGYPVVGVAVTCTNGEYDIFMSTEDHFELAGATAVKAALAKSGSRLLEPWSVVEIMVPADEVGHTLNDIAAHRGRILGMEVRGTSATVRAHCPDRELRGFAPRLQSLTGGRGAFTHTHSHYGWLPAQFTREAIDASPFANQVKRPSAGTPKPVRREVKPFQRKSRPVQRGVKA